MNLDAERRLELARTAFAATQPSDWQVQWAARRALLRLRRPRRRFRVGSLLAVALAFLGALAYAANAGRAERVGMTSKSPAKGWAGIDIESAADGVASLGTEDTAPRVGVIVENDALPASEQRAGAAAPEGDSASDAVSLEALPLEPEGAGPSRASSRQARSSRTDLPRRTGRTARALASSEKVKRGETAVVSPQQPTAEDQGEALASAAAGWRQVGIALAQGHTGEAERVLRQMSQHSDAKTQAKANIELGRLYAERGHCALARKWINLGRVKLPHSPAVSRAEAAIDKCVRGKAD